MMTWETGANPQSVFGNWDHIILKASDSWGYFTHGGESLKMETMYLNYKVLISKKAKFHSTQKIQS